MFRSSAPTTSNSIAICNFLMKNTANIKDRENYLNLVLKSNGGKKRVMAALEHATKKCQELILLLEEPNIEPLFAKSSAERKSLYVRTIEDIHCAIGRLTPTEKSICDYLINAERHIEQKDLYLDELIKSNDDGKNLVKRTRDLVAAELQNIEMQTGKLKWDGKDDEYKKSLTTLTAARFALDSLTSALERTDPTAKSVYTYLANSDRSDLCKTKYLKLLSTTETGCQLLLLTQVHATVKLDNLRLLLTEMSRLKQPQILSPYKKNKKTAKQLCQYLDAFILNSKIMVINTKTDRLNNKW